MKIWLSLYLLLASYSITAADWQPINGIFAITAENYLDQSPNDSLSHIRFQLDDATAKALFMAMDVEPSLDICTDALSKQIENMQCLYFKQSDKYDCHFSININTQQIDYGVAC